ncbi:MAG: tol-pal system protein YbgF [Alphaproteobacteria bacterium]|nr:tol-pal system protein YbgF [Alphaproteobacteria bacterium]
MRSPFHAALAAFVLVGVLAGPVRAQDMQSLMDQIQRMERDLSTLQRQVYRGGGGGDSSSAGVALPDDAAGRLEVRLDQFESTMRNLTGQVEEARFQAQQNAQKLERLQGDLEFRLNALEGRGGPTAMPAPPPPPQPQQQQHSATHHPAEPGAESVGAPPQMLKPPSGSPLPAAGTASAPPAATPAPATPAAGATPEAQYEQAFKLLAVPDYPGAEQSFRAFIKANPGHALAGNAQYWLAETHYVRGDFQQAAVNFLEGYQKYPKATKAPDSLLKLAKSLGSLGQKKEGCAALAKMNSEFPNANETLKRYGAAEKKVLGCP